MQRPRVDSPGSTSSPISAGGKAFAQALREIRQAEEVSHERLGLEAGFDRTYISLIERDQQPDDQDAGEDRGPC